MAKAGAGGSSASWSIEDCGNRRVFALPHALFWMVLTVLRPLGSLGLETPENGFRESKLLAAEGARGDELGWAVAIDGDVLAVGAVNADDAGRVHVFARDEKEGWTEMAVLFPNEDPPSASFGNAVDVDGDAIAVGAPGDQQSGVAAGAAYVFGRTGDQWGMEARVVAHDGVAGDRFGESVSIRGNRLAVGAPSRDAAGTNAGAVYVFSVQGGSWAEEALLVPGGARTGDLFGTAVAIGNGLIVVGAPTDTGILNAPGVAYVFERNAAGWSQSARLTGPGAQRDLFGISVGLDARTIVVGAPRTSPSLPVRPGGSAHVFEEMDSRWVEQAELLAPDTISGDRFGFSVSISGGTIVASAIELCSISVFHRNGIAWRADSILEAADGCQASFGRAVDVRDDTILAGSPSDGERGNGAGAAYVFETSNEEVILGLGAQKAVAGRETQLDLTLDSRAAEVVSFRFGTLLPPDLTLLTLAPNMADTADCRLERDLAGDFALSAIVSPDPFSLQVEVASLNDPPDPLPRDGLIGRCRARVDQDVDPGKRSLACTPNGTAAGATGTDGRALPARCEDAELTIFPPCTGDCNGSGTVSVDEVLLAIRLALGSQSVGSCSALDRDRDRSISVDELVGAVSAALGGCGDQWQWTP